MSFELNRKLAARRGPLPTSASVDPVTADIIRGGMETICFEAATHLGRAASSAIINQSNERNATVLDARGRLAALLELGAGFHPDLTGRENIYLNGAILGMKRIEITNKFDEIVAFAEVEKFIDTPVKHYSSGMAVRLAFAVAAQHADHRGRFRLCAIGVGTARLPQSGRRRHCLAKRPPQGL